MIHDYDIEKTHLKAFEILESKMQEIMLIRIPQDHGKVKTVKEVIEDAYTAAMALTLDDYEEFDYNPDDTCDLCGL